jgi:hypothetical protein
VDRDPNFLPVVAQFLAPDSLIDEALRRSSAKLRLRQGRKSERDEGMQQRADYQLILGDPLKGIAAIPGSERRPGPTREAKPTLDARLALRNLRATPGGTEIIKTIPSLLNWRDWFPLAIFTPSFKFGTARYLDVWDDDHFDGAHEGRIWFSADGNVFWGSPQTKTGRVNCFFRAPSDGNYVCHVKLESYQGPAQVECLIDDFNYGPLPFNGTIDQPHPRLLGAGYHSFRIRQMSGSFFFVGLTVWRV